MYICVLLAHGAEAAPLRSAISSKVLSSRHHRLTLSLSLTVNVTTQNTEVFALVCVFILDLYVCEQRGTV